MGTAPVTRYWILAIAVPLADKELTLDASVSVGSAEFYFHLYDKNRAMKVTVISSLRRHYF